jgi:hypothetical protein
MCVGQGTDEGRRVVVYVGCRYTIGDKEQKWERCQEKNERLRVDGPSGEPNYRTL